MAKKIMAVLCLISILLGSCSKGISRSTYRARSYSYTFFEDAYGSDVYLDSKPQRVAILFSSFAEVWTLAGGEVAVTVGETIDRGFAPEGTPIVDDGAGKTIDAELLISYQPDLVIGSADIPAQVDAVEVAKKAGITAAVMRVETFSDYEKMLAAFDQIIRAEDSGDRWQTYGLDVSLRINDLRRSVHALAGDDSKRPEILFIRAGSSANSVKAKSADQHFAAKMLEELGAHNIADDAPVLLDGLSLEEVLLRDPDCIFISAMGDEEASRAYMDELLSSEGWRDLTAVKEGRCHFLPKDLFHFKPNARWAEAYEYLAALLYPNDFHA